MSNRPKLVSGSAWQQLPTTPLTKRSSSGRRAAIAAALDQLVRRHQRALFALCLRYVRDADEAADLVQRSFVRAMGKLAELRDASVFRSWILRIGAHLALNHIRDHRALRRGDRRRVRGGPDAANARVGSAPERLEAAEAASALRAAVKELPTKQRMTLELRIYEDLPFRDIGWRWGSAKAPRR